MHVVIFEFTPRLECRQEYFEMGDRLRQFIENQPGFISLERFQSMTDEQKMASISCWEDEQSIALWRKNASHLEAQKAGIERLFEEYQIKVARVERSYGMADRKDAPH